MKHIYQTLSLVSAIALVLFANACKKDGDKKPTPTLTTKEVTSVTTSTAISGAENIKSGPSEVSDKGICWAESGLPTISDSKKSEGSGASSFNSQLTGLKENTTYYVRAYAMNASGVSYGQRVSFTTLAHATVSIDPLVSSTTNEITVKGSVESKEGNDIISKGFCLAKTPIPTINDIKSIESLDTDPMNYTFKNLTPNTTYYIRAYAINAAGISYSDEVKVVTDVIDIDGNIYKTVNIGNQVWLVTNLKVTHYRNGDAIPNITDDNDWPQTNQGAYCNYDNNNSLAEIYGRLYNFNAVKDTRNICPVGWRVPTDADWKALYQYLGTTNISGGKMKEAGTAHWRSPNTGATNSSGFTGLPAGYRSGVYYGIGSTTIFWSDATSSYTAVLSFDTELAGGSANKGGMAGFSVRCIKIN
ncbi:FISUMP domain-containing protein [Mucilaginibacter sp. AK015]|uniref:FISUMP domain-containing protein n=1 Tax=Mucilaginibacter sp. AK015 TaxID=2723072 RepID=UPI0016215496|nr:FISUMP domain-containing protein [Mucilaginibacter sp. AK015]MBB5397314.1 uncharacterized protein (TIGR02145 family) [Mucilaginibacter sp. AK015]